MSSKLIDNKKREHAEKVLKKMSQRGTPQDSILELGKPFATSTNAPKAFDAELRDQYEIIRSDLLKLREDLSKSYDVAKGLLTRKNLMKEFLKSR